LKQTIFTDKGVLPGGTYSQAVVVNGLAFISGQGSFTPGTSNFQPGSFREQAEVTFQNIKILLEACGSSFEHVVKVGVFLADIKHFPEMNEVYKKYFNQPFPARTTVQAVLVGDMLIEVDCVAEVPAK
jgi:2-iminobutanoate/2-iminopropanoate deaminase